jgi:copper homeostasis protein
MGIDGIVAGSVRNGAIEVDVVADLLSSAPRCCVTFHRAFEEAGDATAAIATLKQLGQVDRILTTGGGGSVRERVARLRSLQAAAGPALTILIAVGVKWDFIEAVANEPELREIHVGRAAREGATVSGAISRAQMTRLKSILG